MSRLRGLLLLLLAGCAADHSVSHQHAAPEVALKVKETKAFPASESPRVPFLSSDGSVLTASWIETRAGNPTVVTADFDGAKWSEAKLITNDPKLFVNWADFPSVVTVAPGRRLAHWLQKSGDGSYEYDIHVGMSSDGGATWRDLGSPHDTSVNSEYGFVSLHPDGDGGAWIAWLDGRAMQGGESGDGAMQLRTARIRGDGAFVDERVIDERTCECCQTGMAVSSGVPLVVWRDRSDAEVRDTAFASLREGEWSEPRIIGGNEWKVAGCPVNGPQISAAGPNVAVAWFTAADDRPRVEAAWSADGGATFSPATAVSESPAIGRVDVVSTSIGAVVFWLESTSGKGTSLRARPVTSTGAGAAVTIAEVRGNRDDGFPRAAVVGDRIFVSWKSTDESGAERIALTELAMEVYR